VKKEKHHPKILRVSVSKRRGGGTEKGRRGDVRKRVGSASINRVKHRRGEKQSKKTHKTMGVGERERIGAEE